MLKFIFVILFSLPAFACTGFLVEGKLSVDGQDWKISRKFKLGQEESFPAGPYIVSMTFTFPEDGYQARYKIVEKKGTSLVLVTKGEEDAMKMEESRDIMARGEKGQPNSIITLKLKEM